MVSCDCLAVSIHGASEGNGAILNACIACPHNPAQCPIQLACGHVICRDHLPLLRDWDLAVAAYLQPEEAEVSALASPDASTFPVLNSESLGANSLVEPLLDDAEHASEPSAAGQPSVSHILVGSTGTSLAALIPPTSSTVVFFFLGSATVSLTIASQPPVTYSVTPITSLHPFSQFLVENLLDLCEFIPAICFAHRSTDALSHSDIEQTIAPVVAGMHITPQLASFPGDNPLGAAANHSPTPNIASSFIVPGPTSPEPLNTIPEDSTHPDNSHSEHGDAIELDADEQSFSGDHIDANEEGEPDFATPESSVISWTESVTREAIEILDHAEAVHRASQA